MRWRDRISEKVLEWLPTRAVLIEAAMRRGGSGDKKDLGGQLDREAYVPVVFDLEDWRTAISAATDPKDPDRGPLARIYKSCDLDDHLITVIDNRILKLQGHSFKLVNDKGEADGDAKKLMEKMWFMEFIGHSMNSIFRGTKVLEMAKLTETMELKEVTLIPDGHVIAQEHRILKDPAQREGGWKYDRPPLSTYYMQVGKDDQLGVMSMLSVAVLFKKKAVGAWLDYMSKYGVPPRWVITDREDDDRFDELYDMMKSMVSNHFAVLRGNEKIEIMQSPGTDAYQVFLQFIDKMEQGITKRIAGATGTVDEKAFVGAAKVHRDTFNDRVSADKFFIKYLVNSELIPRLVKISTVYAPLADLTFDWDDSEAMTVEDTIKHVTMLAKQFDLDIEEVTRKTGFTVIAQKQKSTAPVPDVKKKSPVKP